MPNYQNGKIYTIRSHQTDEIYIGSTANCLSKRLNEHKSNFKYWKTGKRAYTTSFKIIEFDDAYIELLENYACADKNELNRREGELIRSTDCVNKCVPGRTSKQRYEDNKDKISEQMKQQYQQNKEIRTCVCGGKYNCVRTSSIKQHYNSNKHIEYITALHEHLRELMSQ